MHRFSILGFQFLFIIGCSLSSIANPTAAPTPTDTPIPVYSAPGHYTFDNKCKLAIDQIPIGFPPKFRIAEMWVCAKGVLVDSDGAMWFDVEYELTPAEPDQGEVWREPKRGNRNIFLTDDLGNRYEFLEVGSCAVDDIRSAGETFHCMGWF